MEKSTTTTIKSTSPSSYLLSSPATSVPVSTPSQVIITPCAACKTLRRKCADKCVLAPYFPPTDPLKFTIAHRVFGASNIIKFLQELPEFRRADAVSSMVYEANARLRDPVYGCTGFICQLQKQVDELKAQLANAQAELFTMQYDQANPITVICSEMAQEISHTNFQTNPNFLDDNNLGSLWEPLWT